jgi:hypothetical protein
MAGHGEALHVHARPGSAKATRDEGVSAQHGREPDDQASSFSSSAGSVTGSLQAKFSQT